MPAIGLMRDRVTLQKAARVRDPLGQAVETWQDVATVWAEVVELSGRELEGARQARGEVTTRVSIRYRGDVTPTDWRVIDGLGNALEVSAVAADRTGVFEELTCARRQR